ncbi:spermidine synthase [Flavobacterium sp.]|uniref:spermidine synthase n=1 Tax=Flavobacterium sp. TaxID=239 RepID=UPI0037B3817D
MFKKLFSYIIPLNIYKQKSKISQTLEVTWTNGQLVLDSNNTNYSYGSLQRILRKGLRSIGFEKIRNMKKILVLGVAGGSVIKTLVDEINYTEKIIGVEIDKAVIEIANDYFQLDKIQNLEINIDDALEFVLKTEDTFDLIIIDIFQDTKMPDFLFEKVFTDRICHLLNAKGFILFNTMIVNKNQKQLNLNYIESFNPNTYRVTKLNKMEETNELIIIEKIL